MTIIHAETVLKPLTVAAVGARLSRLCGEAGTAASSNWRVA
jgi:hypothetical protein